MGESLRNSQVLDRPSCSKIPKDSKRLQKIPKDSKRFQKIPKDSKRYQKIPKDSQLCIDCLGSCAGCDQCNLCGLCLGVKLGPCAQCKYCDNGAKGCKKLCNSGKKKPACQKCFNDCS